MRHRSPRPYCPARLSHRSCPPARSRTHSAAKARQRDGSFAAFALFPIGAERVEFADAVQITLLRRGGDQQVGSREQDRLTHLSIPGAEALASAFESGDDEVRPTEVLQQR